MTYKEFYNKTKNWDKRVLIIFLYHNKMILKHGKKWTIRLTARKLGLSIGAVSEGIRLAKAIKDDKLNDCKTREEALIKVRESNAS